ncbi:MAG TPA: hypothetical protein VNZ86_02655 [Bacteroidia bacterium]|nr:hypothetical protein [Bacteroidia bacterium]
MSFYRFLTEESELSPLLRFKIKPDIEKLPEEEKQKLIELIREKDYYEVNSMLRRRFSKN